VTTNGYKDKGGARGPRPIFSSTENHESVRFRKNTFRGLFKDAVTTEEETQRLMTARMFMDRETNTERKQSAQTEGTTG
jgi:hypothetical protein